MSLTITPTYEQIQVVQNQNNVIQVSAQGPVGPPGQGVPVGGIATQYLRKQSGINYDTAWANIVIGEVTGLSAALAALQPLNASLTQISGLTFAANDLIQYVGGVLTNRTPAQVKASLAIATGDVSGLGTMATQNANAVAITGGTISGLTSFANNGNTTLGDASSDILTINSSFLMNQSSTTTANTIYVGSASTGAVNNTFGFFVAGLATALANTSGPYFGARGNTFSAIANQRGNIFLGAGYPSAPTATEGQIRFITGSPEAIQGFFANNGYFSVGGSSSALPNSRLHVVQSDAGTNDTVTVITVGRNSSNTPAANFASSVVFQLKTSTTNDQNAASIVTSLVVATHASYTTRQVHNIYDAGGVREAFRIEASGSAPMIGFLGAAAVIRQALGAWAGLTDAQRITALRDALTNLGLTSYT